MKSEKPESVKSGAAVRVQRLVRRWRLYRCNVCGKIERRMHNKMWIPSLCENADKMTRLYMVNPPNGPAHRSAPGVTVERNNTEGKSNE
jgi:hypothetical protein